MFILPNQTDFKEWQIWHYQKRLTEVTDKKTITFLKLNLKNLQS